MYPNNYLKISFMFFYVLFISTGLHGQDRSSSYPYISGDTFRSFCDFIFDETQQDFKPSAVKRGNTIFVKTDYLELFFSQIHPQIKKPYILLTHNSDYPIPGKFSSFLDDNKILAWFGQNVEDFLHPKLHPIPIGIANRVWTHGDVNIWNAMQPNAANISKDILLYMNFCISTKPDERTLVFNIFSDKPWCVVSAPKNYAAYLMDLGHSIFVLSPRGNGLDCHRTWEALLMGAIPIVKTSTLDSMYKDLPVIIVKDWNIITKEFLEHKYLQILSKNHKMEKIFADYWFNLINSYR